MTQHVKFNPTYTIYLIRIRNWEEISDRYKDDASSDRVLLISSNQRYPSISNVFHLIKRDIENPSLVIDRYKNSNSLVDETNSIEMILSSWIFLCI